MTGYDIYLENCLRFDDRHKCHERGESSAPIKEVFDLFIANCKANYPPGEYLAIDEILVAFRRRYRFKNSNVNVTLVDLLKSWTWNTKITDDNWFPSTELIEMLLLRMTCVNKGKRTKERSTLFPCHTREPNPSMFEFRNHMNLVSHVAKKRKTVILASSIQFSAAIEYESSQKWFTYTTSHSTRRWSKEVWYAIMDLGGTNVNIFRATQHHKKRLDPKKNADRARTIPH
ncbi:hypothetical protein QYM36_000841 [Artemia franciscana]|uniref:PiggyBac transposable element-derived protein domain-containing protein n=1 Tax=Artemia franciscana TaxID=6661 RepID=A0AA88IEB6_ARTSF|nr:hypothetical protein QYM36_000841 [Artemia franciscana]